VELLGFEAALLVQEPDATHVVTHRSGRGELVGEEGDVVGESRHRGVEVLEPVLGAEVYVALFLPRVDGLSAGPEAAAEVLDDGVELGGGGVGWKKSVDYREVDRVKMAR
jgi:hypothetical protein